MSALSDERTLALGRAPTAMILHLRPGLLAAALLLCAAEGTAAAQTLPSLDVRTWRPSTDPSASLVLEPVATPGPWDFSAGAWLNYANRSVVDRAEPSLVPIRNQLGADLTLDLGLGTRAALGVDLPAFLDQGGSSGLPSTVLSPGRLPASGLGDLALTGKGAILTNEEGGFGLAATGALTVPTGNRESFMGEGAATVTARLLADYSLVLASVQASLGYTLLTNHHAWPAGGVVFGDEIPWTFGFLLHPAIVHALDNGDRQSWEVALHGSLPAGPVAPFGAGAATLSPVLLGFSDRVALGHFRDAYILVGGDVGLTSAVGVPTIRAIVSFGWAPRSHDKDHDGVPDDVDQCPDIPEDIDGFEDQDGCPDLDNDDDGILDKDDACPNVKGVPSPDPKKNGCPAPPAIPASGALPTGGESR
jgi:OmpA-OmpF porin, OOP family